MSLHSEIMNIQTVPAVELMDRPGRENYKAGHRHARLIAAELALKADAETAEILSLLERYVAYDRATDSERNDFRLRKLTESDLHRSAVAALAKHGRTAA